MNKVVSFLSSLHTHSSVSIPESEKKKPDVVESYNRTNVGLIASILWFGCIQHVAQVDVGRFTCFSTFTTSIAGCCIMRPV